MPTSDDVMQLAEACAARVSLPRRVRRYASFAEVEEQCPDEYEDLLGLLHEDDVFAAADLERQEELVRTVQIALPEHLQKLVDELVDNQAAQVYCSQYPRTFLSARRCRLSGGPAARCAARKTRSARRRAISSGGGAGVRSS